MCVTHTINEFFVFRFQKPQNREEEKKKKDLSMLLFTKIYAFIYLILHNFQYFYQLTDKPILEIAVHVLRILVKRIARLEREKVVSDSVLV